MIGLLIIMMMIIMILIMIILMIIMITIMMTTIPITTWLFRNCDHIMGDGSPRSFNGFNCSEV